MRTESSLIDVGAHGAPYVSVCSPDEIRGIVSTRPGLHPGYPLQRPLTMLRRPSSGSLARREVIGRVTFSSHSLAR